MYSEITTIAPFSCFLHNYRCQVDYLSRLSAIPKSHWQHDNSIINRCYTVFFSRFIYHFFLVEITRQPTYLTYYIELVNLQIFVIVLKALLELRWNVVIFCSHSTTFHLKSGASYKCVWFRVDMPLNNSFINLNCIFQTILQRITEIIKRSQRN